MFEDAAVHELTDRQRAVLDVVVKHVESLGYPPTVREICEAVGLTSPSTVHAHLAALERAGLIERDPSKPRALKVRHLDPPPGDGAVQPAEQSEDRIAGVELPVLGRVAAGEPILAEQRVEARMPVPAHMVRSGSSFVLEVRGDSMEGAAILDGDHVVVRQQPEASDGQIVVALVDGEATCKRLKRRRGQIELHAENPAYPPIIAPQATLLGIVTGVLRTL